MKNKYPISMIVAVSSSGVIGDKNGIPWHCKEDMAHFREKTLGKPIIMGRTTHESIGKSLPGRLNIVLSKTMDPTTPGITVCKTLDEAVGIANAYLNKSSTIPKEIMVIGGAKVYDQFLPYTERLYYTLMKLYFEGDTRFSINPLKMPGEWRLISRRDSANNLATFYHLNRTAKTLQPLETQDGVETTLPTNSRG